MSKRGRETGIDTGEEEVKKRKNATKDMDNDKHDKESDLYWATWQLIDPLLPTGGFAHSCGLEAAAHAGLVKGKYCISQIPRLFDHTILTLFFKIGKRKRKSRRLRGEKTRKRSRRKFDSGARTRLATPCPEFWPKRWTPCTRAAATSRAWATTASWACSL